MKNKYEKCLCCSEIATIRTPEGIPYCGTVETGGCYDTRNSLTVKNPPTKSLEGYFLFKISSNFIPREPFMNTTFPVLLIVSKKTLASRVVLKKLNENFSL